MTTQTRAKIPEEVKAAALADLVLLSPATVAAKYGIKRTTITGWKTQEKPALAVLAQTDNSAIAEKKQRIASLMLEYLEASLNAQIAQAYVASDPTYINRQPAESLAILHGVMGDKAVRILEALHGAEPHALEGD